MDDETEPTPEQITVIHRDKFRSMATDATDAEIARCASAMFIGTTIMAMIDVVAQTKAALEAKGEEVEENDLVSVTVLGHKPTGNLFSIMVSPSNEEEVKQHQEMLDGAEHLTLPTTH